MRGYVYVWLMIKAYGYELNIYPYNNESYTKVVNTAIMEI